MAADVEHSLPDRKDPVTPMTPRTTIRAGGVALIVGAVAFMGVFSYLAASFDYPEILDGAAADVLPRLLATGDAGRAAWAFYAFLPLAWIPAGVGAYFALRRTHAGAMLVAMQFALLSAISMMLGLMRWPTVHWRLADLQATAVTTGATEQQQVIAALFDGLNSYLGNYIGEFLGEFSFSMFFLLSSWALWRSRTTATWVWALGFLTAGAGFIGMFRKVTDAVAMVALVPLSWALNV